MPWSWLTALATKACAPEGDVVSIREAIASGDDLPATFWAEEYRLNAFVDEYPKPYVAIMDGIVMGGGVGISVHGSVRIATERTRLAMPETAIGFFPDVGGTWLLARLPCNIGVHLGLTGQAIGGPDALALGLADCVMDSRSIPRLVSALDSADPWDVLAEFKTAVPANSILDDGSWMGECYEPLNVREILARLDAARIDDAAKAAEAIRRRSPTALIATRMAIAHASSLPSLRDALQQEYWLALDMAQTDDFTEGVRAVLVDKDRRPRWHPSDLAGVDIDRHVPRTAGPVLQFDL